MFEQLFVLCLQAFIALDAGLLKGRMEHRSIVRKYWPGLWEAFCAYYDDPREKVATSLVRDTLFEDVLQRGHESGIWEVDPELRGYPISREAFEQFHGLD